MKRIFLIVIVTILGIAYYRPSLQHPTAEAAHCSPCCTVNVSQNECCRSIGGTSCEVYPCQPTKG